MDRPPGDQVCRDEVARGGTDYRIVIACALCRRPLLILLLFVGCVLLAGHSDLGSGRAVAAQAGELERQDEGIELTVQQQFHTLLRLELHFIENVCRPCPEQRAKLRATGNRLLDQIADELRHQRILWKRGRLQPAKPFNLWAKRRKIREGVIAAARDVLSPDQTVRLDQELEERTRDGIALCRSA